jgi:hypothetical protein
LQFGIAEQEVGIGLAAFRTIQEEGYLSRQRMLAAEFHTMINRCQTELMTFGTVFDALLNFAGHVLKLGHIFHKVILVVYSMYVAQVSLILHKRLDRASPTRPIKKKLTGAFLLILYLSLSVKTRCINQSVCQSAAGGLSSIGRFIEIGGFDAP